MLFWLHIAATCVMRVVPVQLAHRIVGWATPLFVPLVAPAYLERATANMRQVLGPQADPRDAVHLTRLAFANYARYMVDLVRLPLLDSRELFEDIKIEGWEHVESAMNVGKGVVFATGHIGSWDLAGAAFAARGHVVSAPVETLKPARWNERVQRTRTRAGVRAIPIESGVREMISVLRRKEGLAVLVDRPLAQDGVAVTFFGRVTRVPAGAATLALRTGSPVVPAALVRDPSGEGYVAHIGQPIIGEKKGDLAAEVQHMTQRIMTWLEGIIRHYPDQWYMFRHMWPQADDVPLTTLTPSPQPVPSP